MRLQDALAVLGAPAEWIGPLQASGAHYADVRRLWRALVLSVHPDKHPACISAQARAERAETFRAALAAFDAVEACCCSSDMAG
jgi:preprotein translocase subunit Sec63